MYLEELLKKRGVMPIWDNENETHEQCRKRIMDILMREEYGFMPKTCDRLTWETESTEERFCAGKVTLSKVILTAHFGEDKFSFPVYTSIPNKEGKYPFFIHINFRPDVPDRYMPVEEICDRGFAVLSFCYRDVSEDLVRLSEEERKTFKDPLMSLLFKDDTVKDDSCGTITLWAWAASRVLDYAETLDKLDMNNCAVVGHSRLGKTALLAGALDERFKYAISNDSGCSGAAITRQKGGEHVRQIVDRFPYWFCKNYQKYVDAEDEMPFDQHFLIAAIAPRKAYVASAGEDNWADPNAEYLACVAASEVYEKSGVKGFVCEDRLPEVGDTFHDGNIGYHLRAGTHFFSREDWNKYMDFVEAKIND